MADCFALTTCLENKQVVSSSVLYKIKQVSPSYHKGIYSMHKSKHIL